MKLSKDEKITLTLALQDRREKWMEVARDRIEHLKELGMDITNDDCVGYFVARINESTKLIAKVRASYGNID